MHMPTVPVVVVGRRKEGDTLISAGGYLNRKLPWELLAPCTGGFSVAKVIGNAFLYDLMNSGLVRWRMVGSFGNRSEKREGG